MARTSKRDQIATQSLSLFLTNGFKGTSIDVVVSACGVSKPTVYRHFSDKAALLHAALDTWQKTQRPMDWSVTSKTQLWSRIDDVLVTREAARVLALCIGEGQRFPKAQRYMFDYVQQVWKQPLREWAQQQDQNPDDLEQEFDHRLLKKLMASPTN